MQIKTRAQTVERPVAWQDERRSTQGEGRVTETTTKPPKRRQVIVEKKQRTTARGKGYSPRQNVDAIMMADQKSQNKVLADDIVPHSSLGKVAPSSPATRVSDVPSPDALIGGTPWTKVVTPAKEFKLPSTTAHGLHKGVTPEEGRALFEGRAGGGDADTRNLTDVTDKKRKRGKNDCDLDRGPPDQNSIDPGANTPLFALDAAAASPVAGSGNNDGRPRRRLKVVRRFDPEAECGDYARPGGRAVRTGDGFACPRCVGECPYDARCCPACSLECWYEPGVGVAVGRGRGAEGRGPAPEGEGGRTVAANAAVSDGTTAAPVADGVATRSAAISKSVGEFYTAPKSDDGCSDQVVIGNANVNKTATEITMDVLPNNNELKFNDVARAAIARLLSVPELAAAVERWGEEKDRKKRVFEHQLLLRYQAAALKGISVQEFSGLMLPVLLGEAE